MRISTISFRDDIPVMTGYQTKTLAARESDEAFRPTMVGYEGPNCQSIDLDAATGLVTAVTAKGDTLVFHLSSAKYARLAKEEAKPVATGKR